MKRKQRNLVILLGIILILALTTRKPLAISDLTPACKIPVFITNNCKHDGDSTVTCPLVGHQFCEAILYRCPYVTGYEWPDPENTTDECIYYETITLDLGESEGSNCGGRYVLYLYGCLYEEQSSPPPVDIWSVFNELFTLIWESLKALWGWLT